MRLSRRSNIEIDYRQSSDLTELCNCKYFGHIGGRGFIYGYNVLNNRKSKFDMVCLEQAIWDANEEVAWFVETYYACCVWSLVVSL